MKEAALFLGMVLMGLSAYGQGSVKLNLELHDVQHLTINPDQSVVTLAYRTLEDYKNGVELVQKAHLSVFSTSGYEVKVKLANHDFVRLSGEQNNSGMTPLVRVKANAVTPGPSMHIASKPLTTGKETIISSNSPNFNAVFDITYQGPGPDGLIDYVEKNNAVTFTNDLLYSIETR